MIVIIEDLHPRPTADLVASLKTLNPRLVLVDMVGPQAFYVAELQAAGFTVEPLHYSIRKRLA